LVELIIHTGIHDAIAQKLNEKGKLSQNAVAEGIINNVRKTIIRDQLTDPRFYEQISKLLDDLISDWRNETASYQEFLQRMEALVKTLDKGYSEDEVPTELIGKREALILYKNLPALISDEENVNKVAYQKGGYIDPLVSLALRIDAAMRE